MILFMLPRRRSTRVVAVTSALALAAAGVALVGDDRADAAAPRQSLNNTATTPRVYTDPDAVNLGVRFSVVREGRVEGIQVFRDRTTSATTVTLWRAEGSRLADATLPAAGTGWVDALFAAPVTVRPGNTYVASYLATGRYPSSIGGFANARAVGDLRAPAGAGVFAYDRSRALPASSWRNSDYAVSPLFRPGTAAPTTPTTVRPTSSASPTRTATATPSKTSTSTPTTTSTSTPPRSGSCVGAANTPGGPDPFGGCWPGPHNTGYPHGLPGDTRAPVKLTAYTGPTIINSCGTVIDSKIVDRDILLQAGNGTHSAATPCLTIRNSLVKGVVHTDDATFGPMVISDTEVAVQGMSWWENVGRYNTFAYRLDSHGSGGTIKCADYCEAEDNYVHGMTLSGEYHYNAFGGNGMEKADGFFRILHNWASCGDWDDIDNPGGDAGCSADIGFYGDFAPIRNITISRNFLPGMRVKSSVPNAVNRQPGYCLNPGYYPGKPFPAPSNVKVTDNVFGRGDNGTCGVFGPTNSLNATGRANGNVWSGNRFSDGAAIGRSEE